MKSRARRRPYRSGGCRKGVESVYGRYCPEAKPLVDSEGYRLGLHRGFMMLSESTRCRNIF